MLDGGTIKDLGFVAGLHVQSMANAHRQFDQLKKPFLVVVDRRGVFVTECDFDFSHDANRFCHDAIVYRPEKC